MTPTAFDEVRALKEEISGVAGVINNLSIRKRGLEQKMAETEAEFNSLTLLHGFAKAELERKQKVLRRIEEANQ